MFTFILPVMSTHSSHSFASQGQKLHREGRITGSSWNCINSCLRAACCNRTKFLLINFYNLDSSGNLQTQAGFFKLRIPLAIARKQIHTCVKQSALPLMQCRSKKLFWVSEKHAGGKSWFLSQSFQLYSMMHTPQRIINNLLKIWTNQFQLPAQIRLKWL